VCTNHDSIGNLEVDCASIPILMIVERSRRHLEN